MNKKIYIFIILLICFFTASCKKKQYTVNFYSFDNIIKTETVEKGNDANPPLNTEVTGYTFKGWNVDYSNVTSNLDVHANYEINKYNVTFYDELGNVLSTELVEYNKDASAPNYLKEQYDFVGWDKDYHNITNNLEVRPIVSKKTFEVSFFVGKDNIKTITVEYGEDALCDIIPEKEGYIFTGWNVDLTNVKDNIVTMALFSRIKYEVEYYDHDVLVLEKTIDYDDYPLVYAPAPTPLEGYEFIEWERTNNDLKIIMNAKYSKIKLLIVYTDINEDYLYDETIEYGDNATPPVAPVIEGHEFIGWDAPLTNMTESIEVHPIYKKIIGKITYIVNGEEQSLEPSTYILGNEYTLPDVNIEGYFFDGWVLSEISLTRYDKITKTMGYDYTFYARLIETEKHNPIYLEDSMYHFDTINKNLNDPVKQIYVFQPLLPSDAAGKSVIDYDWTTGDPNIATVSAYSSITPISVGFTTLTATLKSDKSVKINCVIKCGVNGVSVATLEEANIVDLVNVKFVGKDDELIYETCCIKGGSVVAPTPLSYYGYAFNGWDKDLYGIYENTTIKGKYIYGTNKYVGKKVAIIGDSISTHVQYIPEPFKAFYPYPTADVFDVNQTWWMRTINRLGAHLFVNNSYSGTCVADSDSFATKNIKRLNYTLINGEAPDVIMIYMGSNDCASASIGKTLFETSYRQMLTSLRKLCPKSEIVLFTLPKTIFYKDDNQKTFNEIIRKMEQEFSSDNDLVSLVELGDVDVSKSLVDSAHPMNSGMVLLSDNIVSELLKK